jgi:hypothetical protein
VIDGSSLADDAALDPYLEEVLWDLYYAQSVEWEDLGMSLALGTTEGEETTPIGYEVHATVYSEFMLRLMMHIKGFYKSKNGGTFWESDKIRMLWNAAIMDTWLPSARLTSLFGINNVPISNMMTTYNNTSINDSYGSIVDSRGKTLGATIEAIQNKSGHGSTNGLYTSFSFLIGKDNRFEFRPKYNSGIVFNRNNMMVSDIMSDLSSQITNVRIYYANGGAFADWPATNLSDSTNWKIIEYPDIWSSDEALLVAKQEYNQNRNNPLTLTIHPMLDGDVEHKIIESGRYGYIADPYIALDANESSSNAGDVSVWSRLGTGGVLFQGMVNALDGNINTSLLYGSNHINDNKNRYGSSKEVQPTSYPIHWRYNYYWYGSNSISNAVQIVHIPNKTPFDSDATGEHLRMWIDLKSGQSGTDIDNAEFSVYVSDYSFSGTSRSETLNAQTSKNVKHSGFYEIDFPSNYGAVANAKIVFSFNAEYCRALLRLRCGDPTNSNILARGGVNTETIFPLGKRVYSEMGGGFRDERVIWYAPRIQICRDLSYAPATYVSVTDAGLELNAEPMVVKDLSWSVRAGRSERISLTLERDESIGAGGLISYLFPKNNGNRQVGGNLGGGGNSAYDEPDSDSTPPSNDSGSVTDPNNQKPDDGGTKDGTGTSYDSSSGIGVGSFSSTTYGKISGRMNLPSDSLSSDSQFSILGQDKPSATPSSMRGIEGMDVDINTISGTASVSADGYVLGGKGLMGAEGSAAASQEVSIQTDFSVPRDILSNRLSIQANVTHSPSVAGDTKAVLYVTVTVKETGETVTNSVKVGSGVSNQTISLLPNRPIAGLRKSGRHIKVTITRKPGIGDDNANTTSVTLHSLDIRMQRASAHTASSSSQFSPP